MTVRIEPAMVRRAGPIIAALTSPADTVTRKFVSVASVSKTVTNLARPCRVRLTPAVGELRPSGPQSPVRGHSSFSALLGVVRRSRPTRGCRNGDSRNDAAWGDPL
jgi:hypothetical protein